MGRAAGICPLCPDTSRRGRNRTHRDDPVQWCDECRTQVCVRHVVWDATGDRWLCGRCNRRQTV